jgi:hypothetical protein
MTIAQVALLRDGEDACTEGKKVVIEYLIV